MLVTAHEKDLSEWFPLISGTHSIVPYLIVQKIKIKKSHGKKEEETHGIEYQFGMQNVTLLHFSCK